MQHTAILKPDDALRGAEKRVIAVLRAWHGGDHAQNDIQADLIASLGEARATSCITAFQQMLDLLAKHGLTSLTIMPVDTKGISQDEAALARFVMAATEQRRDSALAEAVFLVAPAGLLPLLCVASRFGLPLLCEECRSRILPSMTPVPRH